MLDFISRLSDTVSNLIGGTAADALQSQDLGAALAAAGLDPSILQGLDAQQLADLLAEHGIDIASFAPDQVQGLLDHFGTDPGAQISDMVGQFSPFDRQ